MPSPPGEKGSTTQSRPRDWIETGGGLFGRATRPTWIIPGEPLLRGEQEAARFQHEQLRQISGHMANQNLNRPALAELMGIGTKRLGEWFRGDDWIPLHRLWQLRTVIDLPYPTREREDPQNAAIAQHGA